MLYEWTLLKDGKVVLKQVYLLCLNPSILRQIMSGTGTVKVQ